MQINRAHSYIHTILYYKELHYIFSVLSAVKLCPLSLETYFYETLYIFYI